MSDDTAVDYSSHLHYASFIPHPSLLSPTPPLTPHSSPVHSPLLILPPPQVSKEALDLVQKLLVIDPTKRLSASEAERHPWIASANVSKEHITDAHAAIRSRYLERRNKAKR